MIYKTKKKNFQILKAITYSTLIRKKNQIENNKKTIKYLNLILKLKFTTYKIYTYVYKSISMYNIKKKYNLNYIFF